MTSMFTLVHSVVSDFLRPHGLQHTRLACPSNSWTLLKLMSFELVMPSNHLILCHQGLFKWVSSWHQVAKLLEFQLQHQSFQWIFRTYFFRIDWFDLLVVQGTLKSLLRHHSSKASILRSSDFFIVYLSHPYMTTGKTMALTRQTFNWQSNVSAF